MIVWAPRRTASLMKILKRNALPFFLTLSLVIVLLPLLIAGYVFLTTDIWPIWVGLSETVLSDGTVIPARTYWDVLGLIIVPLLVAIAAYIFGLSERRLKEQTEAARYNAEQNLQLEKLRDSVLQNYISHMSDLLLNKNLKEDQVSTTVRNIGRTITMLALSEVGSPRNGMILQFLFEAQLISVGAAVIGLGGCNLRGANLIGADLKGVNLTGANMENAVFIRADLRYASLKRTYLKDAKLRHADLRGADLSGAVLKGADLSDAKLQDAIVDEKQLAQAILLDGMILPDGTKYQPSV